MSVAAINQKRQYLVITKYPAWPVVVVKSEPSHKIGASAGKKRKIGAIADAENGSAALSGHHKASIIRTTLRSRMEMSDAPVYDEKCKDGGKECWYCEIVRKTSLRFLVYSDGLHHRPLCKLDFKDRITEKVRRVRNMMAEARQNLVKQVV